MTVGRHLQPGCKVDGGTEGDVGEEVAADARAEVTTEDVPGTEALERNVLVGCFEYSFNFGDTVRREAGWSGCSSSEPVMCR